MGHGNSASRPQWQWSLDRGAHTDACRHNCAHGDKNKGPEYNKGDAHICACVCARTNTPDRRNDRVNRLGTKYPEIYDPLLCAWRRALCTNEPRHCHSRLPAHPVLLAVVLCAARGTKYGLAASPERVKTMFETSPCGDRPGSDTRWMIYSPPGSAPYLTSEVRSRNREVSRRMGAGVRYTTRSTNHCVYKNTEGENAKVGIAGTAAETQREGAVHRGGMLDFFTGASYRTAACEFWNRRCPIDS